MSVRFFVVIVLMLVAMLALFLALVATDTALSVWQKLAEAPLWLQAGYILMLVLVSAATTVLAWRWLSPSKKPSTGKRNEPVSTDSLQDNLIESARSGVDVTSALAEIHEQRRRKKAAEIHLAVFGEVSTGKSSLVNALLPDAKIESDPRAGTTVEIKHYRWSSESGDKVLIADLPGFNFENDDRLLEEARRSHLVIFLCDGDFTASQTREFKTLQKLGKPLLVAVNKIDRYSREEAESILIRLGEKTGLAKEDIVTITTGGREEVVKLLADGAETSESRQRPSDLSELRKAIQKHLDGNLELMEALRDTAVLSLASEKLETAFEEHRELQATELVSKYSRRAVVGAMAAVAPGSDLVIQGILATRLIQELCQLYEVSVKDVQIESFLKLAGGKLRNMSAITMAIAGNAMKAFPGVGTLSGGLLHAVAYGLIFDSLGRAAAQTLSSRGDLRPYPAAQAFEELLRENLESGAGQFAKLVVSQKTRTDTT
jgi:GTP-binding protein EngB required for normal cell division